MSERMHNISPEVIAGHLSLLGEGPVWDHRSGSLVWVDIDRNQVHVYQENGRKMTTFDFGIKITALGLRSEGGYIAAVENGFAYVDLEKSGYQMVKRIDEQGNRFNDGKCDPKGRFVAGTKSNEELTDKGNLYFLDTNHQVTKVMENIGLSNGMAWSQTGEEFFFIDTLTKSIWSYKYDLLTGQLSEKRRIFSVEKGYPDGMTIDTNGMLWVAVWDGWKVICINPSSGKIIQEVELPVARVTSCMFGGQYMDTLFITTARSGLTEDELSKQPLAGALFGVRQIGARGIKEFEYKG